MIDDIFVVPIENLPFEVNKEGVVRNKVTKHVYTKYLEKNGYYRVSTRDSLGNPIKQSVHRLMALAFIPNPENKPQVNHINGVKSDYSLENLEWVTESENQQHAVDTGLREVIVGEEWHSSTITDQQVHHICQLMQEGYRNSDISKITGVSPTKIKDIRRGGAWSWLSNSYEIQRPRRGRLSIKTVEWVCQQLQAGVSMNDIMMLNTNNSLKLHHIKAIKNRRTYTDISSNYTF